MKRFIKFLILSLTFSALFISCEKKPLTLDKETSMKTLLNASDKEIEDLILKEVKEKANMSADDVNVEYILRDKESQTIAVKIKNNK